MVYREAPKGRFYNDLQCFAKLRRAIPLRDSAAQCFACALRRDTLQYRCATDEATARFAANRGSVS